MATVTDPPRTFVEDQVFTIGNVEWEQYVVINDTLAEKAGLRMIYLDGSLTLVSPTRRHDWYADLIDKIITAVVIGCGIRWEIAGSATLREEAAKAGVEADRTYYFGDHAALMGGPVEIDLATQPPPDLAIEIEYTNPATKAMAIYDRLGVPEIWRYQVKKGTLTFLHRRPEGGYEPAPNGKFLSMMAPDDLLGQIRLAEQLASSTDWHAQLPAWVHDVILPRMGDRP